MCSTKLLAPKSLTILKNICTAMALLLLLAKTVEAAPVTFHCQVFGKNAQIGATVFVDSDIEANAALIPLTPEQQEYGNEKPYPYPVCMESARAGNPGGTQVSFSACKGGGRSLSYEYYSMNLYINGIRIERSVSEINGKFYSSLWMSRTVAGTSLQESFAASVGPVKITEGEFKLVVAQCSSK